VTHPRGDIAEAAIRALASDFDPGAVAAIVDDLLARKAVTRELGSAAGSDRGIDRCGIRDRARALVARAVARRAGDDCGSECVVPALGGGVDRLMTAPKTADYA
jgi:hypothetical protein